MDESRSDDDNSTCSQQAGRNQRAGGFVLNDLSVPDVTRSVPRRYRGNVSVSSVPEQQDKNEMNIEERLTRS